MNLFLTIALALLFLLPRSALALPSENHILEFSNRTELVGHVGRVSRVAFVPTSQNLLVSIGYKDKTARLWDVVQKKEISQYKFGFGPVDVVISPNGKTVHILKNTGWFIALPLKGRTFGEGQSHWGSTGKSGRMAMSKNGTYFAITSRTEPVTVWNVKKRRLHQSYLGTEDYSGVSFAPNNRILAAAGPGATLSVWDILANEGFGSKRTVSIRGVDSQALVWSVAFSRIGKQLATSHYDGYVTVWDFPELVQRHTLPVSQSVFEVMFSPRGEVVAASAQTGAVHLWDAKSGQALKDYHGKAGSLFCAAFNKKATMLAAGSLDGKIVLWE